MTINKSVIPLCILSCFLFFTAPGCKRKEYATGEAAYNGECVKCHKLNGSGGTKGPELTDIFQKKDDNYFRAYTQDPRSIKADGTMPPSRLSDHELDLVIEYIKQKGRSGSQ